MSNQTDITEEKWVELHESIQDLLAGYADNELDDEDRLIVEAHLSGCENCRNDLARQQILSQRLETVQPQRISSTLQHRIDNMQLDEVTKTSDRKAGLLDKLLLSLKSGLQHLRPQPVIGAAGWVFAIVLAVVMLSPSVWQVERSQIPMINDALAEYHKMNGRVFPVSNTNTRIEAPVNWPEGRVLATWETNIGGQPARTFAVRSGRNIIFQYEINEEVLFRNPEVRNAIAGFGNYKQRNNKTDVLALPLNDSGVLVVGPAESLPAVDKIEF